MGRNDDHFLGRAIPAEIAEHLNEFLPEFGALNHDEFLEYQESVYRSLQGYDRNGDRKSYHGDLSQFLGQKGESSWHGSSDSQLASDEVLARSLQELELEEHFDGVNISQSASTTAENREVSSRRTPVTPVSQNITQDDVDPDNMTYEQLQSLGESVGYVNRGVPKDLISRLPDFKYKSGFLSKKKETQECVICSTKYKNGDKLTALPCAHQYHSKCIVRWLQDSKRCPICQEEVS